MTPEEYKKALRDQQIYAAFDAATKKKFDLIKAQSEAAYISQLKLGEKPDFNKIWESTTKEVEGITATPVTSDFGALEERKVPTAAPALTLEPLPSKEPTITTALAPQQVIPAPRKQITKAYKADFNQIAEALQKEAELTKEEAQNQSAAMQRAFQEVKRANKGISDKEAIEKTIKEIQGIATVKTIKETPKGPQDPLFLAFAKQVTPGEIPDYSPTQQAFIAALSKSKVDDFVEANLPEVRKQAHNYYAVTLKDGKKLKVPVEVYDYMTETKLAPTIFNEQIDKLIKEGKASFFTELEGRPKETDLQAIAKVRGYQTLGGDEWYLDPEKKKKILEKPEEYTEGGTFFEEVTPLGGVAESTASWVLRSALAPFNLVAGVATEAVSSEDLKGIKKEYRKKETPLYADSPVLANIALNKGFTGEAQDAANALNIEEPLTRAALIGGGFAADILDPTLGLAAGAIKGAKAAKQIRTAQKAIYGATDAANISKAAKAAFASEVMDDFNLISATTKLVSKEAKAATKNLLHGDIRLHLADDLSSSIKAKRIAEETGDKAAALSAIRGAGLEGSTYAKVLAGERGEFDTILRNLDAQMKATPETTKLIDELADTQRYVDELARGGKSAADELASSASLRINDTVVDDVIKAVAGAERVTEDALPVIKEALDNVYARAVVFETTPAIKSLENIVAVTRNTWTHKDNLEDILGAASSSPTGRVLNRIADAGKIGEDVKPAAFSFGDAYKVGERRTEGVATPFFRINEQEARELTTAVEQLPIREAQKEFIVDNLQQGKLYLDDHRTLINSNIDQTATRLQEGVVTTEDISRLPAEQQKKMLEAAGTVGRTGGITDIIKDVYSKVSKKILREQNAPSIPQTLSDATLEQRRLIKEIQQEASSLDTKAKREINGLVKSQEQRSLYVDNPAAKMSRMEALGALIVGQKQTGVGAQQQLQTLDDVLNWSFARLFYEQKTYESLTDRVTGLKKLYDNDLLNPKGKELLQQSIKDVSRAMQSNPSQFWPAFNSFINDWTAKISDGVVDGERIINTNIRPKNIEKVVGDKLLKVQTEVGLGMFYFGESTRILNRKLINIVDKDFKPTTTAELFPDKRVDDGVFRAAVKEAIIAGYNRSMPYSELLETVKRVAAEDDVARKAIEYSEVIAKRNKLSDYADMSVADLRGLIDDMFNGSNEQFSALLFGTDYYNQISKVISEGRSSDLTKNLDTVLREAAGRKRGLLAAKKLMNAINSFRYTVLLGLRPRFHGANVLTANAIMYSTIGKMIGAENTKIGFDVAFFASTPAARKANQVAVRTPAGAVYTYNDIYEAVRVSGVRSEFNFITAAVNDGSLVKYIDGISNNTQGLGKKAINGLSELSDKLNDFTVAEDMVFRAGAMAQALKEGKSIEEATAIARRSLFDYNDMNPVEKSIATYFFIFYSFMRQNFTTAIQSLGDAKTLKRYINILKFDRGTEALAVEFNDRKKFPHQAFFPDYTLPRQILAVQKGQEKDYYISSPPIPAIDAILLAADIAQGKISELLQRQLAPQYKLLLGLENIIGGGKRLPSEYISLVSATYSDNPAEIAALLEQVVGGTVIPTATTEEKGAINGYIYELTPEQQMRWNLFSKFAIDFPGLSTPAKDYAKIFAPEGTAAQKLGTVGRILTTVGAITPMGIAQPELQDYYQLKARERAINARLRLLKGQEKKGQEKTIIEGL